ncbi:MAG: site-specific DNA-methyltransferase, partial [Methylococcaceae bacterium]
MIEEKSLDVFAEKLAKLRELFPEVLSEGKIDFKRLQSVLGEEAFFHKEHYELSWAGKSDARAQIQKATSATLIPTDTVGAADSHNIFIEGENLEVLHVLQRAYFGKIKMIYIDPPYNTGNDSFVYPDDYSERQDEYKKRAGITDENGFLNKQDCWKKNSKENGQFHSVWLSMMYPRLYLARNLLREDGVIFISIDDNEQANLKLLCDEIFGAENFVSEFIWKKKQGGGNDSKNIVIEHEKILCFCKSVDAISFLLDKNHELDDALYPFNDEKGEYGLVTLDKSSIRFSNSLVFEIKSPDGESHLPRIIKGKQSCWRWGKDKVLTDYEQLVFKNSNVYTKYYRPNGVTPKSLLIDSRFGRTETGKDDIKKLFNNMEFSYPKPVALISHFSLIASQDNDIILDFFAGSGTTAHAVLDLNEQDGGNRQFICVQMPEVLDDTSEAYKAGYRTIADICKT